MRVVNKTCNEKRQILKNKISFDLLGLISTDR